MHIKEIDFVVLWVDGNDQRLNKLRREYWNKYKQHSPYLSPDPPRKEYADSNEIVYCLASILKNASFARRIHVITDCQRPPLEDLESLGFGKAEIAKISIVDHKDIFKNLPDLAPTFNAVSIETMLHCTPGLADHFVYMNDDFFILKPTTPADYFLAPEIPIVSGKITAYSQSYLRAKLWLLDIMSRRNNVRWSFINGCMSAAMIGGLRFRYIRLDHSPRPVFRPVLDRFFKSNSHILIKNAKHRFRHHRQFQPQALASCLSLRQGKLKVNPDDYKVGYIKAGDFQHLTSQDDCPGNAEQCKRLTLADTIIKDKSFLCIQNLDQAPEAARQNLLAQLALIVTPKRNNSLQSNVKNIDLEKQGL